jgi:subtilisin family serine protease
MIFFRLFLLFGYIFFPLLALAQWKAPISEAREPKREKPSEEEMCKSLTESEGILIRFKSPSEMAELARQMPEANSNFDSERDVRDLLAKMVPESGVTVKRTLSGLSPEACFYSPKAALLESEEVKLGLHRTYTVTFDDLEGKQGVSAKCQAIRQRLAALKAHPLVKHVESNLVVKLQTNDAYLGSSGSWGQSYQDLWGLDMINARDAWSRSEGTDVVVAVVDSGIDYNHPDLWDNIWVSPLIPDRNGDGRRTLDDIDLNGNRRIEPNELTDGAIGVNAVFEEGASIDPIDLNGHGTHVAGTIAAVGGNFIGISGVAPRAKILTIKSFGSNGTASFSSLANGFREALRLGASVSNHSWGSFGRSDSSPLLKDLFEIGNRLGSVAVVAAGNNSFDAFFSFPANLDSVITVAACTPTSRLASFSNSGDRVTLCAPGGSDGEGLDLYNILSTMLYSNTIATDIPQLRVSREGNSDSGYVRLAGTSMATPHVAGGAALLLAINPNLSPEDIRGILQVTSRKEINSPFYVGGMLDVSRALSIPVSLPVARIFDKDNPSYERGEVMDIVGSAFGGRFSSYRLDYGFGASPTSWINLTSSRTPVVNGVLLSRFDSRIALDEVVTLRLQAIDVAGNTVEDSSIIYIPNAQFTKPYGYDAINRFDRLELRANMRNLNTVSYTLEHAERSRVGLGNAWSTRGLTSTRSNLKENNVLIGYLDPKELAADTYNIIRLTLNLRDGRRKEVYLKQIFPSSALRKGFPLSVPLRENDEEAGFREYDRSTSKLFERNQFQYTTILDLDKDGSKEIVTTRPSFTSFVTFEPPAIKVFSEKGELKWQRDTGLGANNPNFGKFTNDSVFTVGDINGDGFKEIFYAPYLQGDGTAVIEAFTHDGKNLSGWPLVLPKGVGKSAASLAIADLNGDGEEELLVHSPVDFSSPTSSTRVVIIDKRQRISFTAAAVGSCSAIYDTAPALITVGEFLPTSPGKEIVFRGGCDELMAVRSDGGAIPGWPRNYGKGSIKAPIAVDIEGDGRDEIVFGKSRLATSLATSSDLEGVTDSAPANTANLIDSAGAFVAGWPRPLTSESDSVGSQVSAADLDGDGRKELVFTSGEFVDELLHVYRANGEIYPGWPQKFRAGLYNISGLLGGDSVLGSVIADINNDKKLDIILSVGGLALDFDFTYDLYKQSGGVFAFNSNGTEIDLNPEPSLTTLAMGSTFAFDGFLFAPPVITDLDNDGFLDLVSVNSQNHYYGFLGIPNFFKGEGNASVYAFSTNSKIGKGQVAWAQSYGNPGISNRSIIEKSLITDPTPTPTATPTPVPYSAANLTKLLNSLSSLADRAKAPPVTRGDREVFVDIKRESKVIDDYLARHSSRLPRVGRENFRDVWRRVRSDLELMDSVKDLRDNGFFRTNLVFLAAKRRALADLLLLTRSLR